jgi:hypothetical protein
MQSNPRGQRCPQTLKLMGPLSPEAECIEQLIVDALHDLANASHPLPQGLGPTPLARVSFGRMDDGCSVTLLPAPVVLNPFETFVGYVWSRADQTHTDQFGVRLSSQGEEGLRQLLVGSGSSPETEACNDLGGICCGEQRKALIPSQTIGPTNVSVAGQPSPCPRRLQSRTGIAELSRAW